MRSCWFFCLLLGSHMFLGFSLVLTCFGFDLHMFSRFLFFCLVHACFGFFPLGSHMFWFFSWFSHVLEFFLRFSHVFVFSSSWPTHVFLVFLGPHAMIYILCARTITHEAPFSDSPNVEHPSKCQHWTRRKCCRNKERI